MILPDNAASVDDLLYAIRIHAFVELAIGVTLVLLAVILLFIVKNSLKAALRDSSDLAVDAALQSRAARRLLRAYLLSALMLVMIIIAFLHLASAANWMGIIDPRSALIMRSLKNP